MKNVTDFYNKTATGWSEEWFKEKMKSNVVEKFYNCFNYGGTRCPKILELGCGAGYDAKIFSKLGAKVVGIDISKNLVEIAKKQVPACKFFVGDICDSMSNLGRFDGIFCIATIMHIDVSKMRKVFDNMSVVLKKGGLLLISAFDGVGKNYEKSLVSIDGETYDKDFNNYNATELCAFAYPTLKLVDTWKFDDFEEGWRYYVFMKQ